MTNRTITLIAYGSPAPQGSKRHVGGGRMMESSKKLRPWRQDVKAAAEAYIATRAPWAPIDAPVLARMVFTVPKPASAPKTRRTYPCRMPDVSKLVRSTEDALTDAGVWKDDARVVEYSRVAKVYPGEDPEALDRPGVRIIVEALA
jgi:Holliday junction resolvase RusA-like endonuclease